ncbi:glycosyltransferase [Patescibacteria group bacterium]
MKIALVYDRINKFGGAERVLLALHQIWPQAPIYTAVFNPQTANWAKTIKIKPSFLNNFPLAKTHHELYPLLTPMAFESFNFNKCDIVISITSAEAKAVITQPKTLHLCYCLTPTRYLWSHQKQYLKSPGLGILNSIAKAVFSLTQQYQKKLDLALASRPDKYIAISNTIAQRIKQYYQKDSSVIYPPVEFSKFSKSSKQKPKFNNYYLIVSRLTPYKKIDLAIKACNQLKQNLIIVGQGRQLGVLKKLAGPTIKFITNVKDQQLVSLYQNALALIMPQEEDFGIVALEAQSAGIPVIAFKKGGAIETIVNQKTGIFFKSQTVDSLIKAMKQFTSLTWDKSTIQSQAKKFDIKIFKKQFLTTVEEQWQKHQNSQ